MWIRTVSGVVGIVALVSVAGCTHDPKPNYSSASPTSTPSTSTSTTASPTPTAVPIDEIPPGDPATWVPAGVPTTAPYKELGDAVPMFTQAMFKDSQTGALASARYYFDARIWTLATLDPKPFLVICDATKCKADVSYFAKVKAAGQHFIGVRQRPGAPKLVAAPASSGADWVVQVNVSVGAGRLVDAAGKTVQEQKAASELVNIYLKWSGKMWRVTDDALAG
jgi:hypothetical protein